jgi:hypothetical protein
LKGSRGVTTNEPFYKKIPAVHPLNKPVNRLAWRIYNRFEKIMEIFLPLLDRQKIGTNVQITLACHYANRGSCRSDITLSPPSLYFGDMKAPLF